MRYARPAMFLAGIVAALTLMMLGIYVAYVSRLWYDASSNW